MKKFLLILLAALAIQSSFGMQPDQQERRVVQLDPEWRTENQVLDKITILEFDEPITDELLLRLNPEWIALKETLSGEQKSQILENTIHNFCYDTKRSLIALLVCIGAEPDTTHWHTCSLFFSCLHQDYSLTKYLLAKSANPNLETVDNATPLSKVRYIELAKLLIENNAQATANSALVECWHEDYPAKILQFYLNMAIKPKADQLGWNAFHWMATEEYNENQEKKVRLLLNAGLDLMQRDNLGEIALHRAAAHHKKTGFCRTIINHFLEQHERFLTLLCCLKKEFPGFYYFKDIRTLLFKQGFSEAMPKLRELLNIKDARGRTAFDIWPIPELDPKTCTYEKYLKLKNTPPNL